MLYRDEKLKQSIQRQARIVWQTAKASRERTCWLGGLATLAWMACVMQLPPIQRAKSVIPHIVGIYALYSINATVKKNIQKTIDTQKSILNAEKRLKNAQTDELYQIHREIIHLGNQFIIKSCQGKEYN